MPLICSSVTETVIGLTKPAPAGSDKYGSIVPLSAQTHVIILCFHHLVYRHKMKEDCHFMTKHASRLKKTHYGISYTISLIKANAYTAKVGHSYIK